MQRPGTFLEVQASSQSAINVGGFTDRADAFFFFATPFPPECCVISPLQTSACINFFFFFCLVFVAVESDNKKETKGGKATKGKADQSPPIKAVSLQINLGLTDTDGTITLLPVSPGSNLSLI